MPEWKALRMLSRGPALALIGLLKAYQVVVSPMRGPTCRYYPSCSAYSLAAIRRHGALRGTALAVWRVLRCNPWSKGGVDHVPAERVRRAQGGAAGEKKWASA